MLVPSVSAASSVSISTLVLDLLPSSASPGTKSIPIPKPASLEISKKSDGTITFSDTSVEVLSPLLLTVSVPDVSKSVKAAVKPIFFFYSTCRKRNKVKSKYICY